MDAQSKLIQDGMQTWYAIREERDKLHAMCSNWERAHTMLQSENEMLKQRVVALEAERGFYARFSSELTANVADIGRLCEGVLVKSKQGAYRPNNAPPRQRDVVDEGTRQGRGNLGGPDNGQEVPKFLLERGMPVLSKNVEKELADITDAVARSLGR